MTCHILSFNFCATEKIATLVQLHVVDHTLYHDKDSPISEVSFNAFEALYRYTHLSKNEQVLSTAFWFLL